MTEKIIRPYTEKDFEGIKKVIQSAQTEKCWALHYFPEGWDDERIRKEFDPMKDYKDPLFLVSEEDSTITGLIAGHDLESFVDNEISYLRSAFREELENSKIYYQRDLIVHKDWQRGFLGFKLFKKLVEHAENFGYELLFTRTPTLNLRGVRFFEGMGYKEIFRANGRIYFVRGLR